MRAVRQGLVRHVRPRLAEDLVQRPHALPQGRGLLAPAEFAESAGGQVLRYQRGRLLVAQGAGGGGRQGDRAEAARARRTQDAFLNRRVRAGVQESRTRRQRVLLAQRDGGEDACVARGGGAVNGGHRQPLLALQGRTVGQFAAHAARQNVRGRGRATPRDPLRVGERAGQGQLVLAGSRAPPRREGVARASSVAARRVGGISARQIEFHQLPVRQPGREAPQACLRFLDARRLGAADSHVPAAPKSALHASQVGARSAHIFRQQGHEARRLRRPQESARSQKGPAQGRVQRQRRQRAAQSGRGPGLVDGTQGG